MKRTLLEIFCGLAALVLMVSFHHQVERLKVRNDEVLALRQEVEQTKQAAGSKAELEQLREQVLAQMNDRLRKLEVELQEASSGSSVARQLTAQIENTRNEVKRFRDEMVTNSERTKTLVDTYIDEVRAKEKDSNRKLQETQTVLATLAGQVLHDGAELTRDMLMPTVQLNGTDTVGSGTIVFSGKNSKTGANETWLLTSFHVVRNILADTPRAQAEGFEVTVYVGSEREIVKGRMIANNPKIDAALVRLDGDKVYPSVAAVFPKQAGVGVRLWDDVYAVGCPLGNDPVPSLGEVSSLHNEINGANYWMINAPTYFGNSGGGVYLADTRQLIGVFSKIYTHGKGNPVVVPHMGLCTPISLIYEWLESEGHGHLLQGVERQRVDLRTLAAPLAAPGK